MNKYVYIILLFFAAIIIGIIYAVKKSNEERKASIELYNELERKSHEAMKKTHEAADVHLDTGSPFEPVVLELDEEGNIKH